MFEIKNVNSDYVIQKEIAAVRNYSEKDYYIVSMEEARFGDFAETRNIVAVRNGGEKILCAVPGAHIASGGAAVIKNGAVFLHQSGVGGWLRAEVL